MGNIDKEISVIMDIYNAYNEDVISKSDKDDLIYLIESTEDRDFEFNLNLWKRNTSKNILFVTGISGSGKSTLASKMAKENGAINIEVDLLEHNDILFDKSVKQDKANLIMKEYMEKTYGGAHKFKTSDTTSFTKEVIKFIIYIIKYAKEHKEDLFIVEGIQIADASTWNPSNTKVDGPNTKKTMDLSMRLMDIISSYPVIVKKTSILKSMKRAVDREGGFSEYKKTFSSLASIKEYLSWYIEMDKNRKQFINNLKKSNS